MRARRLPLVVLLIMGLGTVSGCMQPGPDPVADDEARRIAIDGMRDLAAALAGLEAGTLRAFDMQVTAAADTPDADPAAMTSLDVRMEWGQDNVSMREAVLDDPRQEHKITIWCTGDHIHYQWDGDVYQERTVKDPARSNPCTFDRIQEAADLLAPFTPEGAEALPLPSVQVDRGEVTATFEYGQGDTLVVQHDTRGLVKRINGEGRGGAFEATAEYGPRRALDVPPATERIPAHIDTALHHDDAADSEVYEVVVSWHSPPIAEIEARWVARDPLDSEPVVLLTFPLTADADPASGSEANRFRFEDTDADGRVTVGDRYTFDPPYQSAPTENLVTHELILFDLWADEEVNAAVPSTAAPLVVLLGLALAGHLRRRCRS